MIRVCRHFPQMKTSSKLLSSSDNKFLQCAGCSWAEVRARCPLCDGCAKDSNLALLNDATAGLGHWFRTLPPDACTRESSGDGASRKAASRAGSCHPTHSMRKQREKNVRAARRGAAWRGVAWRGVARRGRCPGGTRSPAGRGAERGGGGQPVYSMPHRAVGQS